MTSTGSRDFKELVKSSIDIVDYIGKNVSLHKKNFDDYRGTVGTRGETGESLVPLHANCGTTLKTDMVEMSLNGSLTGKD